jgi:RNA polymerase sigma-B factor
MGTFSTELRNLSLQLCKSYQQNRSPEIRNRIVLLNLGCVRKEAYHWSRQTTESYEDLFQVGSLGLILAIERFDLSQGCALTSFAVPYIQGEIRHYLRDRQNLVRIPRRWQTLHCQSTQIARRFQGQQNRYPTDAEISAALDISLDEWQSVKLSRLTPLSLDQPLIEGDPLRGDRAQELQKRSCNPKVQEDQIYWQQIFLQVEVPTRNVLECIFFQDLTQRETAKTLGISIMTVSRRLKNGLQFLRNLVEEIGVGEYYRE